MRASDYPEIEKDLKEIPCDKFITNYMPYPFPHNLARDFFLEHKEYTHLIVQPQDLHAKKEHYLKLIETVSETGHDVVSAVCNVEQVGHPSHYKWAICKQVPTRSKLTRHYDWVPAARKNIGIMQVGFQGMVFACISRKIIERKMLDGEYVFKGTIHVSTNEYAMAPDLTFAHACNELGILQYANTDIRIEHLANHKPNLVGKKLSSVEHIIWHE